jgi:hypothetical protein
VQKQYQEICYFSEDICGMSVAVKESTQRKKINQLMCMIQIYICGVLFAAE